MKQPPEITRSDLVQYGNFVDESSVPADYERKVRFAGDIVMNLVRNNYNPSSDAHVLAVKKAICCQVSYWFETGKSPVDSSDISSYSLGELSVSTDASQGNSSGKSLLCDLSLMYLRSEYLLYRGMKHARF